jgi:hypothetical protein
LPSAKVARFSKDPSRQPQPVAVLEAVAEVVDLPQLARFAPEAPFALHYAIDRASLGLFQPCLEGISL